MKELASKTLLVAFVILVAGCSDSISPNAATYTLVAIDGHPVPVSFNYIDGSTTVASGTLDLDGDGYAIQILRVSESGMITTPEHTEVTYYRTLIEPPELRLIPVTCTDACTVQAIGQITSSTITLTLMQPSNGAVYTYQRTGSY